MADCDHDQPSTPELDAAVARQALAQGDLKHAAFHVASALSGDPHRADLLFLLDLLVKEAGGVGPALALWPVDDAPWFGAVAVHARLLGASDPGRAFDLLCQVTVARPDVPYLGWASTFADRVPPDLAAVGLSRLLALDGGDPVTTAALAPALLFASRLGELHPDDPEIPSVASMLARRAGRFEDALSIARAVHARAPTWRSAVALANASRAVGRWDDAVSAWEHALRLEPEDGSVRLDWGDALLERNEIDAARVKYGEVLAIDPAHPWAIASALYCDWFRNPTVMGRLTIVRYSDTHPEEERARDLAERATPWVGWLPNSDEATIGVLPKLVEHLRGHPGANVDLTLTHLESPSSQEAARAAGKSVGGTVGFTVGNVPEPDPREPMRPVRFAPWRWEGTDGRAGLAPPADAVRTAIAKLAASQYLAPAWLERSRPLAAQHGLGDAAQILAVAVHPPPGPDEVPSWTWRWRVVHAVAFTLASFPGWAGTPHREALLSMLLQRNDWLAVGALAALAERGRLDREVAAEVGPIMVDILRDGPDEGGWCLAWPAACARYRLGTDDDPELRGALVRHLQGIEDPPPDA